MARRSYNQYCPIAYSLDVLGERWTLLIVRELLLGPRRFTDLLDALPGIGPNLLSQRLKALERETIVVLSTLPPPAGSAVYKLTREGELLEEVIRALSRWGGRRVRVPKPAGDHFSATIAMSAAKTSFNPMRAENAERTCEVRSDHSSFTLELRDQQLTATLGPAARADLVLHIPDLEVFPQLIVGFVQPQVAIQQGRLEIEQGDTGMLEGFLGVFD